MLAYSFAVLLGTVISGLLLFSIRIEQFKSLSDLIWILAGGASALTAIALTGFTNDTESARRNAAETYRLARTLANEIESFHYEHCRVWGNPPPIPVYDMHKSTLCTAVDPWHMLPRINTTLQEIYPLLPELIPQQSVTVEATNWALSESFQQDNRAIKYNEVEIRLPLERGQFQLRDEIERARDSIISWQLNSSLVPSFDRIVVMRDSFADSNAVTLSALDDLASNIYKTRTRQISLFILFLVFPIRLSKSLLDFRAVKKWLPTNPFLG